jgi:putative addiction module antidote
MIKEGGLAVAMKLKLIAVGDSTGLVLPPELLDKLRVGEGDELHVLETPNGICLSPYDPEFDRQLGVAKEIMGKRHDLLRKLAE